MIQQQVEATIRSDEHIVASEGFRRGMMEVSLGLTFAPDMVPSVDHFTYEWGRQFAVATGRSGVLLPTRSRKALLDPEAVREFRALLNDGTLSNEQWRAAALREKPTKEMLEDMGL